MRVGTVVLFALVAACAGKSNNVDRGATGSGGDGAGGDGAGGATGGNASGGKGGKGGSTGSGGNASGATGGDSAGTGGDGMSQGGEGASTSETGGSGGTGADGSMSGGTGGDGMATGGTANAMGGSAGMEQPPITSCTDEFGFLGTWEGNVLDFFFEPIETVRLVITEDAESGLITGTVTLGEGDPPPPPESADVPYPPGYWDDPFNFLGAIEPWPGVPYTVIRGAGCDATLRFGFASNQIFDDWCRMMEPVYTPEFGWGCTLQGGGEGDAETCTIQTPGGQSATYPMWKCSACGLMGQRACACDEQGCFANLEPSHLYDLALVDGVDGSILSGPDSSCPDCTVRLERME